MMNIEVIALDMDGTLLTASQDILSYTKDVLMAFQEKGTAVVLASGRDIDSLERIGQKLNISKYPQSGYICLNGLEVYDSQSRLMHKEEQLQYEDVESLTELAREHHIDVILFFKESLYIIEYGCTGIIEHHFMTSMKHKVASFQEIPLQEFDHLRKVAFIQHAHIMDEVLPILQSKADHQFDICKVEPDWLEINPCGINKGTSLKQFAKLRTISLENIIAFGNGENDIEMLKMAGKGVAMKNSFENVKEFADDVCGDNEHDGIGLYLKKYL